MWVIKFPTDILHTLLTEWLGLSELCSLDSAICNRDSRNTFLKFLSDPTFVHQNKSPVNEFDEFPWKWLCNRNIGILCMYGGGFDKTTDADFLNNLEVYLISKGNSVTHVRSDRNFGFKAEFFALIATYCVNLER